MPRVLHPQRQHRLPVLQVVYKEAEKSPRGALGRPACPPPRAAESKCEPFLVCGRAPCPVLVSGPSSCPRSRGLPQGAWFLLTDSQPWSPI